MMHTQSNLEGGCLCGLIRYTFTDKPFAADYCHCRICQKSTGSPVAAWMDFKVEHLLWIHEQPSEYASSEYVRRGFCSTCGSTLSFRDVRHPGYITLTIASLDNPNTIQPTYHIYTKEQLEWFQIQDTCIRYPHGQTNG